VVINSTEFIEIIVSISAKVLEFSDKILKNCNKHLSENPNCCLEYIVAINVYCTSGKSINTTINKLPPLNKHFLLTFAIL